MCMAAKLSNNLGMINKQSNARLKKPSSKEWSSYTNRLNFNVEEFIAVMSLDKKNTNGQINLILLDALGKRRSKDEIPPKTYD